MWIFFDIDGTLLDHDAAFTAGTAALYALGQSTLAERQFVTRWSDAHRRNFDRFLAGELTHEQQRLRRVQETFEAPLTDDDASRLFKVYIEAYESAWSLFPDALGCLDALTGHRLGVISNGNSAQQRSKLARLRIADRFQSVMISEYCGCAKPNPKIFRAACAASGVSPRDAAYVGDMYDIDAQGARDAGLTGIWLDRRRIAAPPHAPPIVCSLAELPALISRLDSQ